MNFSDTKNPRLTKSDDFVKPIRMKNNRETYRKYWWRHGEPQSAMRSTLDGLDRYILTPRITKHRLFVWQNSRALPDDATIVFAFDDDTTFGILQSCFHELWSLRLGTSLEDRPRYTPSTSFQTFPFPEGPSPNIPVSEFSQNEQASLLCFRFLKNQR